MTFLILGTLKFREKAPGLIFFKGPFWGAYIRRGLSTEGNLRFKIDWASLIIRSKFTVLLCISGQFSKYNHRGAYIWSGDLTEGFFALPVWVAYFWRGLFSEFYGMWKRRACQIGPAYDLLFIILSKRWNWEPIYCSEGHTFVSSWWVWAILMAIYLSKLMSLWTLCSSIVDEIAISHPVSLLYFIIIS